MTGAALECFFFGDLRLRASDVRPEADKWDPFQYVSCFFILSTGLIMDVFAIVDSQISRPEVPDDR